MATELPALTIDGERIDGIAGFYAEINRVFMSGEDWQLGQSLDALDDMFYGGYGALHGSDGIILVWKAFERSREALGLEATRQHYRAKLAQKGKFDIERIRRDLAALESGTGPTYFDIVLQIIADHPNIVLRPA